MTAVSSPAPKQKPSETIKQRRTLVFSFVMSTKVEFNFALAQQSAFSLQRS